MTRARPLQPASPGDTANSVNGSHTLQAYASDAAGNTGVSTIVTVTVQNSPPDTTAPTAQITSPANNARINQKTTKVYVTTKDNIGVTRVDLLVDGKAYAMSPSSTPIFSWNTGKLTRGSHTLQAVAYDAAGNKGASVIVTVSK